MIRPTQFTLSLILMNIISFKKEVIAMYVAGQVQLGQLCIFF